MSSSLAIETARTVDLAFYTLKDINTRDIIAVLIENYPDLALRIYHELSKEYT